MVVSAAIFIFTFDATVEHSKLIRAIWELGKRGEERGNEDQLQHPLRPTYKIKDRENGPQIQVYICLTQRLEKGIRK